MATLAKLLITLGVDATGVGKGVDKAESKLQKFGKGMGKVGMGMTAAVTLPILGMGVAAVSSASDLDESMNKVDVVFGDSASAIQEWSKQSATAFGMSRQEALEATGTYGNLFRAMEFGTEDAAEMSMELVGLAADLASFNNMDPNVALDKLRAGLTGETEPLKALGVFLTQDRIAAEALMMGLGGTTVSMAKMTKATLAIEKAQAGAAKAIEKYGADSLEARTAINKVTLAEEKLTKVMAGGKTQLTANEKAQASYALIMKDTALAQGDFGNTSEGLANSQRIIAALLKDVAAIFGQELLPIVTEGAKVVKTLLTAFTNIPAPVRKTIVVVLAVAAAVGPLLMILSSLIGAVGVVSGAFSAVAGVIGIASGGIVAALSPILIPILAIIAVVALLYLAWKTNFLGIRDIIDKVVGVIKTLIEYFRAVLDTGDPLNDMLTHLPKPLRGIALFIGKLFEPIKTLIKYFRAVLTSGDTLNDFLSDLPKPLQAIARFFGELFAPIGTTITLFKNIIRVIKDVLSGNITLKEGLEKIKTFIGGWAKHMVGHFKYVLKTIASVIFNIPGLVKKAFEKAKEIIPGIIEKINAVLFDGFGKVLTFLGGVFETVKGIVKEALIKIVAYFVGDTEKARAIVEKAFAKIKEIIAGAWEIIKPIVSGALEVIKKAIATAMEFITGDWSARWETIKSTIITVWEGIKTSVSASITAFVAIVEVGWGEVKKIAASIWGGIKDIISSAWSAITGGTSEETKSGTEVAVTSFDDTLANITATMASIETTIGQSWNRVLANTSTSLDTFKNTIILKMETALFHVRNINQYIVDDFTAKFESVHSVATTIFARLVSDMLDGLKEFKRKSSTLLSQSIAKIITIISGASTKAYDAGAGLVDAFAAGISARQHTAIDAARRLANELRSLLPGSDAKKGPLKHLTKMGVALPVTLAKGVKKGASVLVRGAMKALTPFGSLSIGQGGRAKGGPSSLDGITVEIGDASLLALASMIRTGGGGSGGGIARGIIGRVRAIEKSVGGPKARIEGVSETINRLPKAIVKGMRESRDPISKIPDGMMRQFLKPASVKPGLLPDSGIRRPIPSDMGAGGGVKRGAPSDSTINVTINNPTGQPAEADVMRQLRNLQFMGVLEPSGGNLA